MKKYFFILIFYAFCFNSNATCCKSTGNGDWANGSTWSCGYCPTCGDTIIIQAGHTVTITSQQNYAACTPTPGMSPQIVISGALKFVNGFKLSLPCGSNVFITPTGSLVPGSGGGNSNYLEICNNIVWNAASGTISGPSCYPPGCSFLPIELVYFKGNLVRNNLVELSWLTATEINNDRFELERSTDAVNFEMITKVPSKAPNGTSNVNLTYSTNDGNLSSNLYYYRLKQIDLNASSKYSSIISVDVKKGDISFNIYPNPNNGEFTVDLKGIERKSTITLKIINPLSQFVHSSEHNIIENTKLQITPVTTLSKGVYTCILNINNEDHHVKLVVQ